MFNDTTNCPMCGDENAYFNGVTYECPDCGYEWDDSLTTKIEETDEEKLQRVYRQQDISRVGTRVNLDSIRRLFSPSYQFEKWHTLYRESGLEEDYYNALIDTLLETGTYQDLFDLSSPGELSEPRGAELLQGALRDYLESRDDLPAFPTAEDWASYVAAPTEVILKVLPHNGADFQQFLPLTISDEDFTILFHPRIAAFYKRFQSDSEEPLDDASLRSVEDLFTEIVMGEERTIDNEVWFLERPLRSTFANELKAIQAYREARSSGAVKNKIQETRSRDLTTGDSVAVIVDSYLSDVLD